MSYGPKSFNFNNRSNPALLGYDPNYQFQNEQISQREQSITAQQRAQAGLGEAELTRANDLNSLLFGKGGVKGSTNQFGKLLAMLGFGGGGDGSASGSGGGGANPGDYAALLGNVDALISQTGQSQRNTINRNIDNGVNSSLARLQDRGLASSNLTANTVVGGERARNDNQTQLMDALLGQRAGAMQNIGLAGLNAKNQQYQFNSQMQNQNSQLGLNFLSRLLG